MRTGGLNGILSHATVYGGVSTGELKDFTQSGDFDCGYSCLKYILWRQNVKVKDGLFKQTDSELSFFDLANIFRQYDFSVEAYEISKDDFIDFYNENENKEFILHFLDNHFIVMLFAGDIIVIFDPSYGEVYMAKSLFLRSFDGKFMVIGK